jgi:hypothetical protein
MIVNITKNGEIEAKNSNVDFNSEKTFYEFFHVHSAEKVEEILDILIKNNQLEWKDINGTLDSGSGLASQNTTPVKALTELEQNSFDALIDKYTEGIQEKPDSFLEAVEYCHNKHEKELKNQLYLISTGIRDQSIKGLKEECLSITIIDKGIGQNNENFENTLLSISGGIKNKTDLNYFSGKLGMGQWAAINFCKNKKGEKKGYQLVVSKTKDSKIWSWSLTRLNKEGRILPIIQYLKINGSVPTIESEHLNLIPNELDYKYDGRYMYFGTLKKLYSYDLECKSVITNDLKYDLNSLLPKPAFTVKILERRTKMDGVTESFESKTDNSTMTGFLENFLLNKKIRRYYSSYMIQSQLFNWKIPVHILIFDSSVNKTESVTERRSLTEAVYFILNGQQVGTYSNTWLTKNGFDPLKDDIKIIVDYSFIPADELFDGILKGIGRDGINKQHFLNKEILDQISDELKNDTEISIIKKQTVKKLIGKNDTSYKKQIRKLLYKNKNTLKYLNLDSLKKLDLSSGDWEFIENGGGREKKSESTKRKNGLKNQIPIHNLIEFIEMIKTKQVVHLNTKWKKSFIDQNNEINDKEGSVRIIDKNQKSEFAYVSSKFSKFTLTIDVNSQNFKIGIHNFLLRIVKSNMEVLDFNMILDIKPEIENNNRKNKGVDILDVLLNKYDILFKTEKEWKEMGDSKSVSKVTDTGDGSLLVNLNPNHEYLMEILNDPYEDLIKDLYRGILLLHIVNVDIKLNEMKSNIDYYSEDADFDLSKEIEKNLELSLNTVINYTNSYSDELIKNGGI